MTGSFTANFLGWVVAFIFGIAFREFSKAVVADRLGDRGPRKEGRLTLNPTAHHHPLGLILAFISSVYTPMLCWGKPIEINTFALRGGRLSMSLVAAVGLLSNVLVAWVIWLAAGGYIKSSSDLPANFLKQLIFVNLLLFAFDLLPLPPLDGYYLIKGFLPNRWDEKLVWLETNAVLVLVIVILFVPFLLGIVSRGTGDPLFQYVFSPIVRAFAQLLGITVI
jgi:Zn-dependent protease